MRPQRREGGLSFRTEFSQELINLVGRFVVHSRKGFRVARFADGEFARSGVDILSREENGDSDGSTAVNTVANPMKTSPTRRRAKSSAESPPRLQVGESMRR